MTPAQETAQTYVPWGTLEEGRTGGYARPYLSRIFGARKSMVAVTGGAVPFYFMSAMPGGRPRSAAQRNDAMGNKPTNPNLSGFGWLLAEARR
jgi:hypothetical protein